MYANGTGVACRTFQATVMGLNQGFKDRIRWMKLSEIARYWAARELTSSRMGLQTRPASDRRMGPERSRAGHPSSRSRAARMLRPSG
jgi:hypothetical protein